MGRILVHVASLRKGAEDLRSKRASRNPYVHLKKPQHGCEELIGTCGSIFLSTKAHSPATDPSQDLEAVMEVTCVHPAKGARCKHATQMRRTRNILVLRIIQGLANSNSRPPKDRLMVCEGGYLCVELCEVPIRAAPSLLCGLTL